MRLPIHVQREIQTRAYQLNNFDTIKLEKDHGVINNLVELNTNNNRGFLLDALQVPIKSFNERLRHPNKRLSNVNCESCAKHTPFRLKSMHPRGVPNNSAFKEFDQLAHLFARIKFGYTCKLTSSEAGTLYYLSGQLEKSLRKILNAKDIHRLMILRDGLAKIYT